MTLTDRARKVLTLAHTEGDPVGPKELLLGMLKEGRGVAAYVLSTQNITSELVRRAELRFVHGPTFLELVLASAVQCSAEIQDQVVGTEHLLLGLITFPQAAALLQQVGTSAEHVRAETLAAIKSPFQYAPGPIHNDLLNIIRALCRDRTPEEAVAGITELLNKQPFSEKEAS